MRHQSFTPTMTWENLQGPVHWGWALPSSIKWTKRKREKVKELVFVSPPRSPSLNQKSCCHQENLMVLKSCSYQRKPEEKKTIYIAYENDWCSYAYFAQAAKAIWSQCPWSPSLSLTTGKLTPARGWNTDSLWTGRRLTLNQRKGTSRSWRVVTNSWKPWAEKDSGQCLTHWEPKLTITSSTASIPG